MIARISGNFRHSKPYRVTLLAASVARPFPQCSQESRQANSTLGVKCASKLKYFSPTNPINLFEDRSSTAKSPKPKSLKCDCILSSDANVSFRVIRLGRNSQTLGSAFNKANGSMSSRFQFLKISLGVLRFSYLFR